MQTSERERGGLRRVSDWRVPASDLAAIIGARHGDPFGVLGLHMTDAGLAVRAFVPHAEALEVITVTGEPVAALTRKHPHGFFEGLVTGLSLGSLYKLRASNAGGRWDMYDPYAFPPVLGALDDYLFAEGTHHRVYERLGAHLMTHEGVPGVHFAVWAPNARRVAVVGDFNGWDGRRHQMRKRLGVGIWELFAPEVTEGTAYKYEIVGLQGELLPLKADPVGFRPSCGLRLPPLPRALISLPGRMNCTSPAAPRATRAASRWRSTRSISARGSAGKATVF